MKNRGILRDKTLALFLTTGISLKLWHEIGMIDREVALYNELSKYFKYIYLFTYGGNEDLNFKNYLSDNIIIVPRKYIPNNLLYSCLLPFIYPNILKKVNIIKTNQMFGSWAAVLAKLIYRKRLVVRAGYMLSIFFQKGNPNSKRIWVIKCIERLAYKFADGIISTTQTNYEYVKRNYNPTGIHVIIPNYVETDRFKPTPVTKKMGSICFIGRLTEQKNLFALLEALKGLHYSFTLIGSGEQEGELKKFASENKIKANFLGNIPNHKLPKILSEHELFVLPSLWEGMPKTLLEAMACGLPVIGTRIDGTKEIIEHGNNGILCDFDSGSIRKAIITLMEDEELRRKIGLNARKTIEEKFSLGKLIENELELYSQLFT